MRTALQIFAGAALLITAAPLARAQTSDAQPLTLGDVAISGSIRARAYSWDWFDAPANGDYAYPASLARLGASQSRDAYEWHVDFAVPVLLHLPADAVAGAPQGQLGLGATYFAANSNVTNSASLFLKQGFVRWKHLGGIAGQSIAAGRLEFNEGAEVTPKNATLAALKRDRIAQRLVGNFGFSDVGRSIDGAQYSLSASKLNVTALAGRPTQGVFQVNGWPELSINLFYGAVTRQIGDDRRPGEWRVFGLVYDDYRRGVLKTDNRSVAARTSDTSSIRIGTYGAHYLLAPATPVGPVDLLFWGAIQTGSWGALSQRAGAYAVEAGWQPTILERVRPWLRAGVNDGSGDANSGDQTHGTFFQVLPTPRIYARLPFFNMMNSRDTFGELIVRPTKSLTLRTDAHALRLATANDLWYSGGGAFQQRTFGYTGRPSNGQSALAQLYDLSADYMFNAHLSLAGYYGRALSRAVARAIFPAGQPLRLGYGELLVRF